MAFRTLPLILLSATALFGCELHLTADCDPPPRGEPRDPPFVLPVDQTWDAEAAFKLLNGWQSIPYCAHPPGCPHGGGGSAVPEPGTAALACAGAAAVVVVRRRWKRSW